MLEEFMVKLMSSTEEWLKRQQVKNMTRELRERGDNEDGILIFLEFKLLE